MNNLDIGIFDSGVGGLTVARAIRDILPHENISYVADTAFSPYGPKPISLVRKRALEIMDSLVDEGVKMLVIACNTASAAVLRDAYERYNVPVVEVIKPAVMSALSVTRNKKIALIGTTGTIKSRSYDDLFSVRSDIKLYPKATPKFVPFVESGITSGEELEQIAAEYFAEFIRVQVDTMVLGCTHYPFLRGVIAKTLGYDVSLVSSDTATAVEVYKVLSEQKIFNNGDELGRVKYRATANDSEHFMKLAKDMLHFSFND